ncbi:MAG: sulfurtransferase-like selenium metabolism protein YedF [bacterium]
MSILVDARGLDCPKPVVKTKEAFEQASGQSLLVMVSSAASRDNVVRFLKRSGAQIDRVEEQKGEFHIYTQAGPANDLSGQVITTEPSGSMKLKESMKSMAGFNPEDYSCTSPYQAGTSTTIFITRDRIGQGGDELGINLLNAFIATIKDLSVQPRTICFMNSGVKLTIKGAGTLAYLQELEEKGIELLVCGTCLNYFHLTGELGAGKISNMYDISEAMLTSTKVITI